MHVDESAVWVPQSEQDKDLVRQQMNRLLETTHFRNSRRYPALFRFIIEEALAGRGEYLKERLIGVQVFGRPPDYDTAADPVVRVTIAEIRKRIAQYYHDEAHDHEMRIELLPGSYEPEFRPGREGRLEHIPAPLIDAPHPSPEPDPSSSIVVSALPVAAVPKPAHDRRILLAIVGVIVCVLAAAAVPAWQALHPSAVEQLWAPILAPHRPVMLIIPVAGGKYGDAAQASDQSPAAQDREPANPWVSFLQLEIGGENVVFSDVTAMTRISDLLAIQHAEPRPRLNTATTLDDLRQGPAVLIGGLDNQWTLRALDHLRYGFAGTATETYWILDRKDPDNRQWALDLKVRISKVTRDYALVARVHDQATGQPEIIVAGIGMSGTAAAGELLVRPQLVEELRRRVGSGFKDRDFEAVLSTDVVNGIAGSPRILTVEVQ